MRIVECVHFFRCIDQFNQIMTNDNVTKHQLMQKTKYIFCNEMKSMLKRSKVYSLECSSNNTHCQNSIYIPL